MLLLLSYTFEFLQHPSHRQYCFFFFNDPPPTEIYTLSLHDALPISRHCVDPPRKPDGRDGHMEAVVVGHRMTAEAEERFAADTHLLPHGADALLHLLEREGIVPRGYRRVGREDARRAHPADGFRAGGPSRHELTHPLDQHERGVSFVGVPGSRVVPQRAQHAHTAHTEDPFLPQSQIRPAGVEPVRQLAIGRVVLLVVRVQQEDGHAAHHDPPGPDAHRTPGHPYRREARVACRPPHRLQWRGPDLPALAGVLLPPV